MSKYIDKDKVLEFIIFGVVGKEITCGELTRAIESLPTIEVSEDCISREVAIGIIKNYDFKFPQYMERFVTELRDAMKKDLVEDIRTAPSVIPKRSCYRCGLREDCEDSTERKPKEGEWIPYSPEGLRYKCSECESKYDTPWHFCPNCGAKMRLE